jgi:glycosyltransferase involved in cell wall biosynthesis
MRVLQVHNRYREAGGEDTVVSAEAELLRDAGHEVVDYLVDNPEGTARAAGAFALAAWNPWAERRLVSFARDTQPDVVHVHNTWFSLSPAIVRGLSNAGFPVVMTLHNYRLLCANAALFRDGEPCELCIGGSAWNGLRHRCYRDSLAASGVAAGSITLNRSAGTWTRHVDLFLALTTFARERFLAGGLPAEKIVVKPNFTGDPGARPAPPSSSNQIVFVGRLYGAKGVLELIDTWQAASPRALELVIVGDGPLRGRLEEGAPKSVRFAGPLPRDRVLELMMHARALVFPSHMYEGQPMAVLEAMAAGLPILASDRGGIAATLAGAPPATLVSHDQEAWHKAVFALEDDGFVDGNGRAMRRLYEGRFTPSIATSALVGAYETAVAGA